MAKILADEATIKSIKRDRADGLIYRELSEKYNICLSSIRRICHKEIIKMCQKSVVSEEDRNEIKKRAKAGEDRKKLATEYGVSIVSVHNFAKNKSSRTPAITMRQKLESLKIVKKDFEKLKSSIHIGDMVRITEDKETKDIVLTGITENFIFGKNNHNVTEAFTWNGIFCGEIEIQKYN